MITRVGLAPAHPDLTTAEAVAHWRTTHADVATEIPGLRRYVQLHPLLVDGRHPLGHPGFEVCALTGFDDLAAMEAGFASPAYREAVRADEAVLIDRAGFTLLLGASTTAGESIEQCPGALAAFLRMRPGASSTAIVERLAHALDDHDLRGHELVAGIDADPGRPEQLDGDVLLLAGFADADAALAWARAATGWAAVRRDVADVVFGHERFVATPHRVV